MFVARFFFFFYLLYIHKTLQRHVVNVIVIIVYYRGAGANEWVSERETIFIATKRTISIVRAYKIYYVRCSRVLTRRHITYTLHTHTIIYKCVYIIQVSTFVLGIIWWWRATRKIILEKRRRRRRNRKSSGSGRGKIDIRYFDTRADMFELN